MTEPDKYSLASLHSEELLAGAHFNDFADKKLEIAIKEATVEPRILQQNTLSYEEEKYLSNDIRFTIKDLEKTHEDFLSGSY